MIQLTEPLIDITMKIEMDLSQPKILDYLAKKGYEIKAFRCYYPPKEEMLISEPELTEWTFTATKEGEKQSNENIYTNIFEREIKRFFKEFSKI